MMNTAADASGPSRAGYYIAAIIGALSVVGGAVCLVFFVLTLMDVGRNFQRVVIPPGGDVTLAEPGRYTIFYEHQSTVGGQRFNSSQQLPGVNVSVREAGAPNASPLPVTGVNTNINYSTTNSAGYAVWEFTVPKPGTYRIDAQYTTPSPNQPPRVLAVGRGMFGAITQSILFMFGGLLIGGVGLTAALILFIVTLVRRQSARKTAANG
jgi:hypothetical protein